MAMVCRVVAGIAGGVLGAGAMAALQVPLRGWLRKGTPGALADSGIGFQAAFRLPELTAVTAQRLLWRSTFGAEHPLASALTVHAGFGASAGLFYACFVPRGIAFALGFGVVLWLGPTEAVLPSLRLTKTASRSSLEIQAFGLGEHLLYAWLLHQVRRSCCETGR